MGRAGADVKPRNIPLVVSVDVEEDNWRSVRDGVSAENVRELPKFAALCERLGIRPTYFVTYQAAAQPWAQDVLRELCTDGRAELASHIHPWNTPPFDEEPGFGATMLRNYGYAAQLAKIRTITDTLSRVCGKKPVSFRAGRFGVGRETIAALIEAGYGVDSSVTPFYAWGVFDGGPEFFGADLSIYTLDGRGDVRRAVPGGPIVEVPLSTGFTRFPVSWWTEMETFFRQPAVHALHLRGMAARTRLTQRVILSPELTPLRDMLALSRRLLRGGVSHLNLMFHSSSLRPGLTPFVTSQADVRRLCDRLEAYVDGLTAMCDVEFRTVAEVAATVAAGQALSGPSVATA